MNMNKLSITFLVLAVTVLAQLRCTSNPVGTDGIGNGQSRITGNVALDNENQPERVFVWLEEFDVGTYTDSQGNFSLDLPSGQNEKVTGVFKLYFFVANYKLDFEEVAVREGAFVFDQAALDSQGRLGSPKHLKRFLSINTTVEPASIRAFSLDNIDISLTLQTDPVVSDTATVLFPKTTAGFLGPVFFQNIATQELFVFATVPVETQETVLVGSTPIERSASLPLVNLNLPPAEYAVIPFMHVTHQEVPAQLLTRIGPSLRELGANFLRTPTVRKNGYLEVRPAN